jgi:hypothetical protein
MQINGTFSATATSAPMPDLTRSRHALCRHLSYILAAADLIRLAGAIRQLPSGAGQLAGLNSQSGRGER